MTRRRNDETQPLDLIRISDADTLPETHERSAWLSRLVRALERPTLNLKPLKK